MQKGWMGLGVWASKLQCKTDVELGVVVCSRTYRRPLDAKTGVVYMLTGKEATQSHNLHPNNTFGSILSYSILTYFCCILCSSLVLLFRRLLEHGLLRRS